MKKIIFILLGFGMLLNFSSCEKDVVRGTQTPKNVGKVKGLGRIGTMVKHYDFSEKFLPCWDYGFSDNEDFGRWCVIDEEKNKGFLIFQVRKNATVTLKLDFRAFVSENHPADSIRIATNGVECGTVVLTEDKTVYLNLESQHINSNNAIELDMFPLNAKSPKELGINEDTRKIGFGLKSVTLWAYYPVEKKDSRKK